MEIIIEEKHKVIQNKLDFNFMFSKMFITLMDMLTTGTDLVNELKIVPWMSTSDKPSIMLIINGSFDVVYADKDHVFDTDERAHFEGSFNDYKRYFTAYDAFEAIIYEIKFRNGLLENQTTCFDGGVEDKNYG